MQNKPNKSMLIWSIIGLMILVPAAVFIAVTNSQNGMLNAAVFLLLIVDVVNIIVYIVSYSKYRKASADMQTIQRESRKLNTPAKIVVTRGANDGMQSSLELDIFNNGAPVGKLSVGTNTAFQSDFCTNTLTGSYVHPLTKEPIPMNGKLTLELSDGDEVQVFFEKKKFHRTR